MYSLHLSCSYSMLLVTDRPPSAARRAHDHVKQRLLDGTYRDGELLSEGAIAQELSVSRTPVREAFLQLEAEGLLELYPKRGALVVPVSARDVADLFEARLVLERHCLARVAADPSPELAEQLGALIERQRERLEAGDRAGFAVADRQLHRAWVAAAGNGLLLGLYDQLRDRQQRITARMVLHGGEPHTQRLVDEHERMVAALTSGDADAAIALLELHLAGTRAGIAGA
jgi:DNA-binding GntR family transcriptional regulator